MRHHMKDTPGSIATFKGTGPVSAEYAKGGEVITSKSRFMKEQDTFRTSIQRTNYDKKSPGGELSDTEGDSKKQKAIKPSR